MKTFETFSDMFNNNPKLKPLIEKWFNNLIDGFNKLGIQLTLKNGKLLTIDDMKDFVPLMFCLDNICNVLDSKFISQYFIEAALNNNIATDNIEYIPNIYTFKYKDCDVHNKIIGIINIPDSKQIGIAFCFSF